ncbi:hypothetical protein QRX48_06305, partial [Staphylococcus warneri]
MNIILLDGVTQRHPLFCLNLNDIYFYNHFYQYS